MAREKGMKKVMAPGIIAAAFVSAIIIFVVMLYTEKKVLASEEKVACTVLKEEMKKGMQINADRVGELFETKMIASSLAPQGYIENPEVLVSLLAVSDISEGSIVTECMFYNPDNVLENMDEPVLLGFKAEDLYQVIGGTLRKGDRIHIYSCDEDGSVYLRWNDVYIESAFDFSGDELAGETLGKALRFNIYLEKEDVEEFYGLLDSKKLRAVKACG